MGAVVPAGKRAVNFCVVTTAAEAEVGAVAALVPEILAPGAAEVVVDVGDKGVAPELAAIAPVAPIVAGKEFATSFDTCAAAGNAGSMPPTFLAPGPQIAAAITPTVAKMAASVSGNRDFFFCSLKSLTPFKQSITKPICQFWNCVNFVHNDLNWILQPIKMGALCHVLIVHFQNDIRSA